MTPKERFLLTAEADAFRKTAHSDVFVVACDVAMLDLIDHLPAEHSGSKGENAMANAFRLEGARLYRARLEMIAEKPAEPPKNPKPFDHRTT